MRLLIEACKRIKYAWNILTIGFVVDDLRASLYKCPARRGDIIILNFTFAGKDMSWSSLYDDFIGYHLKEEV